MDAVAPGSGSAAPTGALCGFVHAAKAVGWNDRIPIIAGWEQELQQLEMQDAASRQVYGGPEGAQEKYVQLMGQFQMAQQQADLATQAAAQAGQPAPMNQLQPPPEPFFVPQYKPERIYQLWIQKIQKMGGVQLDTLTQEQLDLFLRFRSVVETYGLMRDEAAMAMQMPARQEPQKELQESAMLQILWLFLSHLIHLIRQP